MSDRAESSPSGSKPGLRPWMIAGVVVLCLAAGIVAEVIVTRPVRQAVAAYTAMIGAANRQDLDALRRLCTRRYLAAHPPEPALEGGIVGLPRNIHKNFQAWRHGEDVWLCPTNRVGPIYRFRLEAGSWKFDGPVGLLRPRGEVVPYVEMNGLTGGEGITD